MKTKLEAGAVALMAAALMTGCLAVDGEDDGELGDELTDELADSEAEVVGWVTNGGQQGMASVTVTGQGNVHTGVVIATDAAAGYSLILTSNAWLGQTTPPANVTTVWGAPSSGSVTRTARFINDSAFFPASIIQVAAITGPVFTPDSRTSAQLAGVSLRCYEYDTATRIEYVDGDVTATSGDNLTVTYWNDFSGRRLEGIDAGAPCFDGGTGSFVGIVTGASATAATVFRAGAIAPWLDGMKNLAAVRNHSQSTRLSLYNLPVAGNTQRMCLDVPWGSPFTHERLNQFACHYGQNQRFWLDFRVDANRPRLVSESSGLCIDVPNASTTSGEDLQQYPCHNGINQRWDLSIWNDSLGGWKIRPNQALATCLSVNGGASLTGSIGTEQRTCAATGSTTNRDQRWFPVW